MTTTLDIAALKALEAAATPGPWFSTHGKIIYDWDNDGYQILVESPHPKSPRGSARDVQWLRNREFIAYVRNAAPALIAAYEREAQTAAERDDLADKVYVPGLWKCPKCGFTLVQRVFRASDGAVGLRDEAGEHCPNDGAPLWRVSERDAGNELADRAQEYLERAVKAEAQADRLRALLQQAGEALDGVIAVADRKTVEFDRARTARAAITTELGEHK